MKQKKIVLGILLALVLLLGAAYLLYAKLGSSIAPNQLSAQGPQDSAVGALRKLEEEVRELREAVESGRAADAPHGIREETGDVLFIAAKVAQMSGVDPEDALHRACDKFDRRFRQVETAADKPLADCSEEELVALWKAAKQQES